MFSKLMLYESRIIKLTLCLSTKNVTIRVRQRKTKRSSIYQDDDEGNLDPNEKANPSQNDNYLFRRLLLQR